MKIIHGVAKSGEELTSLLVCGEQYPFMDHKWDWKESFSHELEQSDEVLAARFHPAGEGHVSYLKSYEILFSNDEESVDTESEDAIVQPELNEEESKPMKEFKIDDKVVIQSVTESPTIFVIPHMEQSVGMNGIITLIDCDGTAYIGTTVDGALRHCWYNLCDLVHAEDFQSKVKPEVKPEVKQKVKESIDQRFIRFHENNTHVYDSLVELARKWKTAGHDKLGVKMLFEVLRWEYGLKTYSLDEQYTLSNDFTSRYARLIMANEEDLKGMFNLRKLDTETTVDKYKVERAINATIGEPEPAFEESPYDTVEVGDMIEVTGTYEDDYRFFSVGDTGVVNGVDVDGIKVDFNNQGNDCVYKGGVWFLSENRRCRTDFKIIGEPTHKLADEDELFKFRDA